MAAILESEADGLALIGKQRDATRSRALTATILGAYPALVAWLAKRPLTVLGHAESWPRLLAVLDWVTCHPRSGVYLRQIDAAGIDTKFIEHHRGLLGELLDIVLPPESVNAQYTGAGGFEMRYGFKPKPPQIRFRILDQLRSHFPSTRSLLMNRETLLEHRAFWGREDSPATRELNRLQPEEAALYDDLRCNRFAPSLRLEQERIGFTWVEAALVKAGFH